MIIFCLVVAIISLLFATFLFNEVRRTKKNSRKVTISTEHIEECILPNNKGKSIDDVVELLKQSDVPQEFSLDFSPLL